MHKSEKILVLHPGQQHSHQLAWGIHEIGQLKKYISGTPVLGEAERPPFWMPPKLRGKLKRTGIPQDKKCYSIATYALMKTAIVASPKALMHDNVHRVFHAFDLWAATQVSRFRPQVVVAYENSAFHSFRAAKAIGARCVLDLASIEHRTAGAILGQRASPYLQEINRRKDAEVEMADLMITCSSFARESYKSVGVPDSKLTTILLGAEPSKLVKGDHANAPAGLKFLFAGSLSHRKSIDLLLLAFERLWDIGIRNASLDIVGPISDLDLKDSLRRAPNVRYHGAKSQEELFNFLRAADCFILPSRFDSFGMVVVEALAQGTPVIVSTMVGAKELLEHHPGCGWIVQPDFESIFACVLARITNPDSVHNARSAALKAAEEFTWHAYRSRVGTLLTEFLSSNT